MITTCPKCKKVFNKVKEPLCPTCYEEEESYYEKVRAYLKENPGVTLEQVSEETDVSIAKINKYIRDGRLSEVTGDSKYLKCTGCGKPIKKGKMCDSCVVKFGNSINGVLTNKKPTSSIMHVTDRK